MNHSESIKNLAAAMVKAQAEMQGVKKGADNPFFKSKYADLSAVQEATKPHLHNNGLAIMQFPVSADGMCGTETIVIHTSGEWVSRECLLACSKQDPQAYGSAITYSKRYGWQAVCGLPTEDDDGNSASFGNQQQQQSSGDDIRF